MHLKRFLLLFIIPLFSFGQTKLYVDQNMNEISLKTYKNKCKSHITKCLEYKTDSISIHKVLYKYSFGKINPTSYKQIKSLLQSQSGTKIKDNSLIILKYSDSLRSLKTIKLNYEKHVLNCPANHGNKDISKIQKERLEWVNKKKKCINKFSRKRSLSVNYIYKHSENPNTPNSYIGFDWIKDRGVFKNLFFKIMYSKNFVILKPDGEYFLSGSHIDDKHVSKLIETDDWTEYKNDWLLSTTKSLRSGKGFFKANNSFHKEHCF